MNAADLTACAVALVGFSAFWSNPRRPLNRIFFSASIHVAVWLVAFHLAVVSTRNGLFWLKIACAVGAWVPLHVWLIQQTIAERLIAGKWIKKNLGWLILSAVLSYIPFTEFFIPSNSTAENPLHGWGFYFYLGVCFSLYVYLFRDGFKRAKTLTGGQQLDLNIWLLGGCITAAGVLLLMGANSLAKDTRFIRAQPMIVLVFYASTAFAIMNHRIFDARQIALFAAEKSITVGAVSLVAFGLNWTLSQLFPTPFDFIMTTALTLWFAVSFSKWLATRFNFYPQATEARRAAYAVAETEKRPEELEKRFLTLLKGWGHSDKAMIFSGAHRSLSGGMVEVEPSSIVARAMRQLRWATPERLNRERSTPDREELKRFIEANGLGVLVAADGPSFAAFVGVGIPVSRRPFTYPQVYQLLELSMIIENALERSHFSEKAQNSERLATVGLLGASVAHEIRNPLVSIKTFVQHLPNHYQDPAFREKFFKLIGSEVSRIDQLTEQLLDLSSPRTYDCTLVELDPIIKGSLELASAKATDKSVSFTLELDATPSLVLTDADAARQVLLNLLFNAIQAIESQEGDRWIKVSTRNLETKIQVSVEDSGPGISEEIRSRLFQPFQTTKSSGFGLGLATSSNILASLNASITVDPPSLGKGALFRIDFPCQA